MERFILKGSIGTTDVIELQGDLLEKTLVEVREKLFDRLKQGITDIVVLCEKFKHIDSTGISLFIEISDLLQGRGGKLHLVACPLSLMIPMKSLGMVNFFEFYKNETEVFRALKITREEVAAMFSKKTNRSMTQIKKQVAIKDHVRNKMILFKHYETSLIKDVVLYLQSTYSHFREREIELAFDGARIPQDTTLKNLFEKYHYHAKKMLSVEDVTPEPPNYKEMMRRGGKLYDRAIIEMLIKQKYIDKELADSVSQIANLNQEPFISTLIEGNYLAERKILQAVGTLLNWKTVSLSEVQINDELTSLLTKETGLRYNAYPVRKDQKRMLVAMSNPVIVSDIKALEQIIGLMIVPIFTTEYSIRQKWEEQNIMWSRPEPAEDPESWSVSEFDEEQASGYFGVETAFNTATVSNIQEFPLENISPEFLEESLSTLKRLEQSSRFLHEFARQVYRKAPLTEILQVIIESLATLAPVEHALFLLDQDGSGELIPTKFSGIQEYQSLTEQQYNGLISDNLILQVKKTQNIVGARHEDHSIHLAIPFVARRSGVVAVLYLISPQEHGMYDINTLSPLTVLFAWGAGLIENEALSNRIRKLEGMAGK